MLKNLFIKVPVFNMQKEIEDLQGVSDKAVEVFGNMIYDLGAANEKLNNLAVKADMIADEHSAMAIQARSKVNKNQEIIDKITKLMA